MPNLQDRIKDVRAALLRNGYLLERTGDEGLRIRQARDVLESRGMKRRDELAKELERNPNDADEAEHKATLADLAMLQQQPAVTPVLP